MGEAGLHHLSWLSSETTFSTVFQLQESVQLAEVSGERLQTLPPAQVGGASSPPPSRKWGEGRGCLRKVSPATLHSSALHWVSDTVSGSHANVTFRILGAALRGKDSCVLRAFCGIIHTRENAVLKAQLDSFPQLYAPGYSLPTPSKMQSFLAPRRVPTGSLPVCWPLPPSLLPQKERPVLVFIP